MISTAWIIRAILAVQAAIGLYADLPYWALPAASAVLSSGLALAPWWPLGRYIATASTLLLFASVGVAVYWVSATLN